MASDTLKIPNHGHCWVCGKAVPFGEKTCGAEHQAKFEETQRKRKTMMWIMYGSMAVAVAVLLYGATRGGA